MSESVINLLDDDDDSSVDEGTCHRRPAAQAIHNPYSKPKTPKSTLSIAMLSSTKGAAKSRVKSSVPSRKGGNNTELQSGVVFEDNEITSNNSKVSDSEDDVYQTYTKEQEDRRRKGERPILFHDPDFQAIPSSIEGKNTKSVITCRCKGQIPAKMSYKKENGRPYYRCSNNKCKYFKWAFSAELMQWYRFGSHTGHKIVNRNNGFRADDLVQGKVGDCWFLSALAVVAERPDLIMRLFNNGTFNTISEYGMVRVNLFLDGYWKTITIDTFLPCIVDNASEKDLQQALQASLGKTGGAAPSRTLSSSSSSSFSSSKYDPNALADSCREVLDKTRDFLERNSMYAFRQPNIHTFETTTTTNFQQTLPSILQRPVDSQDLAYSKAKHNQLWVQYVEKAYAKSHGCYQAISGGQIAEAFLDLTGAPTLECYFDHKDFEPRNFWYRLMHYRKKKLPMGCGTSSSAVGIIGMHAYSILDVVEVKNVDFKFFMETGVAHGNVSGFTEYDGTVRLLKIRNPHGQGEWKGDFSDKSDIWEKLLQHQQHGSGQSLQRSMKNDGTFWIDYDNFLLGFTNVDIVLAFLGNHAKSFSSNFPIKKSTHRCARTFEVSLLEGEDYKDETVELYIMGIQKTKRGASKGRVDRKKSYKPGDLGILVCEVENGESEEGETLNFQSIQGKCFGLTRNGHLSILLKREANKRLVVMPISFGHPAATDKDLPFVLRFVSDAPLFIRERSKVPSMDLVMQAFCLSPCRRVNEHREQKVLLQESMFRLVETKCSGTIFLYLVVNESEMKKQNLDISGISISVEANCRGMSCRTDQGLLQHETVAKGKKFTAAWRRFTCDFLGEKKSRLLLVLFQSGVDTEFKSLVCKRITARKLGSLKPEFNTMDKFLKTPPDTSNQYHTRGIFNSVDENDGVGFDSFSENNSSFQNTVEHAMMEQTTSMSRDDMEMQQALELSMLERSKREHPEVLETDDDLSRALKLSMEESQQQKVAAKNMIVDLTEDETPTKRQKTDPSSVEPSVAEKRRLAREAALNRMNLQQEHN